MNSSRPLAAMIANPLHVHGSTARTTREAASLGRMRPNKRRSTTKIVPTIRVVEMTCTVSMMLNHQSDSRMVVLSDVADIQSHHCSRSGVPPVTELLSRLEPGVLLACCQ